MRPESYPYDSWERISLNCALAALGRPQPDGRDPSKLKGRFDAYNALRTHLEAAGCLSASEAGRDD